MNFFKKTFFFNFFKLLLLKNQEIESGDANCTK